MSRKYRGGDDGDAGDAPGRIARHFLSAGGRAVAGSNPVAPMTEGPLSERAFGFLDQQALGSAGAIVPLVVPNQLKTRFRSSLTAIRPYARCPISYLHF